MATTPLTDGYGDVYKSRAYALALLATRVKWPPESGIENKEKPYILGVIGETKSIDYLNKLFSRYLFKGKRVTVRHFSTPRDLRHCHILYIPEHAEQWLPEILSFTSGKPILTIGENRAFIEKGIHIVVYVDLRQKKNGRTNSLEKKKVIAFDINPIAMRKVKLSASTGLFRAASYVMAEPKREKK